MSFQWRSGTANVGTDGPTYTVRAEDLGRAITVTVTRAGYSGSVTGGPVTVVGDGTGGEGDFGISFAPDIPVNIEGPTVSILESRTNPQRLTVLDAGRFDGWVTWFRGTQDVTWWGMTEGQLNETLVLGPGFHQNVLGTHVVTVEVRLNGVPYSRVVTVRVVP